MHRSGTSAITRVISLLGAALPSRLMPPSPNNNILGFWEPLQLSMLHDQMLAEAGSSWDGWQQLDLAARLSESRLANYKAEIVRELDDCFGTAPFFVLKDPRVCRFVPLYREILAGMGVAVRPVLTIRHPSSVAASLQARDGIPEELSRFYWLRHLLDAEAATRDLPRAFVRYEALLEDWRAALQPVASQLGVEWPIAAEKVAAEIDAFLQPEHDHGPPVEPHGSGRDPIWRCYEALLRLPAADAAAELDALGASFDAAATLCTRAIAAERATREQALVMQRGSTDAALAESRTEREALTAEISRLQEVVKADRAAHEEALERQQSEAAGQITAVRAEVAAVSDEVARLTKAAEADRLDHERALAQHQAEAAAALEATRIEAQRALAATRAEAEAALAASRAEAGAALAAARAEATRRWESLQGQILAARERADTAEAAAATTIHGQEYRLANARLANAKLEHELAAFDRLRLRRLFSAIRKQRLKTVGWRLLLRPLDHLQVAAEDRGRVIWRITGDDPQFDLGWIGAAPLPPGHYRLTLAAPARGRFRKTGRLYVDSGAGYSEAEALDLSFSTTGADLWRASFVLPRGARALRFDPSSDEPTFVVGKVRLRRISRLVRGGQAVAQLVAAHRHRPVSLVGIGFTAAFKLLTGGPRSLGRYLRGASQPPATPPDRSWAERAVRLVTTNRPPRSGPSPAPTIAVHAHIFYLDLLDEITDCLAAIPYPTQVYVSTTTPGHRPLIEERLAKLPHVTSVDVRLVENRGRDIAPLVIEFGAALARADLVAHLHTKRSPHNLDLRGWRRYLFDSAFGSQAVVRAIVNRFLSDPDVGLLFPATYLPVRPFMRIGANGPAVRNLLQRYGSDRVLGEFQDDFFPAGSVFWCRGSLIRRLLELNLKATDFEPEAGQVDGTLAHALERILPSVAAVDGQVSEEYVIDDRKAGESPPDQIATATDILILDHMLGGGTKVFTNHAVAGWMAAGFTVQRLTCDIANGKFVLQSADPMDGGVISFPDLDAVQAFYGSRRIGQIIVNSLVTFPSPEACVDLVQALKQRHQATLVYHVHDFYCVCPSQHLLDAGNRYCGVPCDLAVCATCAATNLNMWHFRGPKFSMARWRQAFQRLFDACDEVIVFDESAVDVLRRAFTLPDDRVRVRPHERTVALTPLRQSRRAPLHIGLIGTLNHCKGFDLVNELADHVSRTKPGTPITLVGSSVVPPAGNVSVLGAYEIRDLPEIITASGITVFLIASIVPETFCYTLDELMAMELPVVAFDLGAQGRRTAGYPHGTVLPAGCSIEEVYRAIAAAHARFYGVP
jgi:glycosyltransferase involved in cell wall biosynthesis